MKISKKYSPLILWGTPVIIWIIIYFFLGFDGYYGQDSYEYLRYSKAIHRFLITGENPGDYFWPLYYPILGGILGLISQNLALSLLLISVLSLSVSGIYLYRLIILLYPQKESVATIYVLVLYILSPYVLRSSMTVMSDMLATCFIVLSIYNFYKFKSGKYIRYFYGIAIFGMLAVLTRYASFVVLLPLVVLSTIHLFRFKKYFKHIPLLMLIVAALTLPHLLVRLTNYNSFLSHQWLQSWSIGNFFKSSFTTVDGTIHNMFPNLIYSFFNTFHPGYIFLGIIFIILFILKPKLRNFPRPLLFGIIIYAFFLAGIPFQNNRFLLLSYPLVIISFFPAFNYLMEKLTMNQKYIGISLVILIQFLLITRAFRPVIERNLFEIEMTKLLKPYQNETLYSFDIDIALKGRGLKFYYHNLWEKKYNNFKEGDLVLFHPSKFEEQWKGKNPIINWNYLNTNFNLEAILNCPNGWKLYKIQFLIKNKND